MQNNIHTLLREARESKGLTIKDAARELNLKERHLQMLEDGQMAQLSREIYLKGLMRAYSNWLNVDSSDAIGKVSHEKKSSSSIPTNKAKSSVVPLDLSYLAKLARRPGINIFLISAVFAVGIYIIWYSNHKTTTPAEIVVPVEKIVNDQQFNVKYSNVQDPYLGQDIVFFPHADVELKVLDTGTGEEKTNKLSDGDVFFLKMDEAMVITSNAPESIEVFTDNEGQQELIGTLDKMLISF